LGSSETFEDSELFRIEHKKECIYRKRDIPGCLNTTPLPAC
jgi:hypothetical protein